MILKYLPYGPQFYDEDTITDQPERQIVAELIREKALHSLNEEIPHGIAVAVERSLQFANAYFRKLYTPEFTGLFGFCCNSHDSAVFPQWRQG